MKKALSHGLALVTMAVLWLLLANFVWADPVPQECFEIKLWGFEEGRYPVNPEFVDSLEVVHPRDRISVRCSIRIENIQQELSTQLLHVNPNEENLDDNEEGEWRFWIINEKTGENILVDQRRTLLALGEYDVQVKGVVRDTVEEMPGIRKDRRVPLTILQVESNPGPTIEFETEIVSHERETIENRINGVTSIHPDVPAINQYVEPVLQPMLDAVKQRMEADEPRRANDLYTLASFVSERSQNEFQALMDLHEAELAALQNEHDAELERIDSEYASEIESMREDHQAELASIQNRHDAELQELEESYAAEIASRENRIIELQEQVGGGGFPLSLMLNVILGVGVVVLGMFIFVSRRQSRGE